MTTTPASKGKDRAVSSDSVQPSDSVAPATDVEDIEDAEDNAAMSGGGSSTKKTTAAGQKRDEVVVSVPPPGDATETLTDVKVAGPPSSSSSSADDTVMDMTVLPSESSVSSEPEPELELDSAEPSWASAIEPADSIFAGRADTPPTAFNSSDSVSHGSSTYGAPPPVPSSFGPIPPAAQVPPPAPGADTPSVVRPGRSADGRSPRRAHLQVSRFEPLSVMKFSFVMSLVCFVILLVAVTILYMILSGLGVFDSISNSINSLTQDQSSKSSFDASSWFSFSKIFGYTALVGGLNVLIITALATVGSVIYNIAADFVGGVEVTLKEAE